MSLADRLADRAWRLDNLYLIRDERGIIVPFEARHEQREFRRARSNRNAILKARKLGLSTDIVIGNLDDCLFRKQTHAAIIDRTEPDACDKLEFARLAWEQGPNHPNPAVAAIWRGVHATLALERDNDTELRWSNGSKFEAGTSFRGGTPNRLHISEFGSIAAHNLPKAKEIRTGALNAVPPDGIIDVETTFEGGPFGACYDLFKLAMDTQAKNAKDRLDWIFHFFPWWRHPSYVATPSDHLTARTVEYFAKLKADHGLDIPPERQSWWDRKAKEQGEDMTLEFPSLAHEPFSRPVSGSIYPVMRERRAAGAIGRWALEDAPLVTAWDLGVSDSTAGWLAQVMPREILFHGWFEGEGLGAAGVAEVIRQWEQQFGRTIAVHLVPHDAAQRDKGSGRTYIDQLAAAGIARNAIRIVPRTPDVWVGIGETRKLLGKAWFHARCDEPRLLDGETRPSGVGCLENYRRGLPTAGGVLREMPVHDATSHTADAARTLGEGVAKGLHAPPSMNRGGASVVMGIR